MTALQVDSNQGPIYHLSQELIDEIIDTVSYSKEPWEKVERPTASLFHCSLVCKAFLPRSQMHLFSQITLPLKWGGKSDSKRIKSLIGFLKGRPSLNNNVKGLHLLIGKSQSKRVEKWTYDTPEMIEFMKLIPKASLTRISLQANIGVTRIHRTPYDWQKITNRFFSQGITSLHFTDVLIPAQMVSACPNLKDLALINTKLSEIDIGHPVHTPPFIKTLEYAPCRGLKLSNPIISNGSYLNLSSLRHLTVATDNLSNLNVEQQIIDASGRALEELIFKSYRRQWQHVSLVLNLREQVNLHTIRFIALFDTGFSDTNFSEICSTLSTIPASNNLKALYTTLVVPVDPEVLLEADWERFGKEMARLASEGTFKLELFGWFKTDDWDNDAEEQLCKHRCMEVFNKVVQERLSFLWLEGHPWQQIVDLLGTHFGCKMGT